MGISRRGGAIVWRYRPGPGDMVRCARCGQSCMPFPVRNSRLCAACVHAVTSTWPDPLYRRTADLARALLVRVSDDPASVAADALERILGVERCELFLREAPGGPPVLVRPRPAAPEALGDDVVRAVERLDAPLLIRDDPDGRAEPLHTRGWEAVVPVRAAEGTSGLLALGPKAQGEAFTEADRHLLALAGAAVGVALERARLSEREVPDDQARCERLAALGMVAAGAAHEVRNQLVPVKTLLDLLPERLADPDLIAQRDLALEELRKALDLIGDLLALGRPGGARLEPVLLPAIIEWVVRLLEPTARRRRVTFAVRSEGAVPPVRADPERLKQVLLNLVLNAIEASAAGHELRLEVRPVAHRARRAAVIELRDQGPGIPPEQLRHIFEPFFTTRPSGTGLGLALVRRMVREMGGIVSVESEVGRGTVFRVTLPAAVRALTDPNDDNDGGADGGHRWRRPRQGRRTDVAGADPKRRTG